MLLSLTSHAAYKNFYSCPRYAGGVAIGDGIISFQLLDDRPPIGKVFGDHLLSSSRFAYAGCADKNFLCIAPMTLDGQGFFFDLPIAVPKIINPGQTYKYLDVIIETRPIPMELRKGVVRVVGRRGNEKSDPWYALTIQSQVGVVDFHLSKIHAVKASTGDTAEFESVSCYLDSARATFPEVLVRKQEIR